MRLCHCICMGYKCKKILINNNGFSSSQLVFVQNCNLPNTNKNTLPASNKSNYSSDLAKQLP